MGEKRKNEKVVGYALLTVGVVMIFVSVYLMFNVFTGVTSPPVLVHFSNISMIVPFPGQTEGIPAPSPEQTEMTIVSGQALSKLVAIGFWYTFMFFIMMAGGRLASLGVALIKETRVEVKETAPATRGEEGVHRQENQNIEEPSDTRDDGAERTH